MEQAQILGATDLTPAAAAVGSTIYLGWRGQLGAESLWWASITDWPTGAWSGQAQIPNVGSAANPGMTADQVGGLVYMFWRGAGGDQGLYWSTLGSSRVRAAQQNLVGESSSTGPAAATYQGRMFLAWKGAGNDTNVYLRSLAGGAWSGRQQLPGAATDASPSLSVVGSDLVAAWRGAADEGIYVSTFDGSR